jgi:hypothetical protein
MRCSGVTMKGFVCKNKCSNVFCNVHKTENFECGVCYELHKSRIKLDCSHEFCDDCIFRWICVTDEPNCPMCRTKIDNSFVLESSVQWGLVKGYVYIGTLCKINISSLPPNEYNELVNVFNLPVNTGIVEKTFKSHLKAISTSDNDICKLVMMEVIKKTTFESVYIRGVPGGDRFNKLFVFA